MPEAPVFAALLAPAALRVASADVWGRRSAEGLGAHVSHGGALARGGAIVVAAHIREGAGPLAVVGAVAGGGGLWRRGGEGGRKGQREQGEEREDEEFHCGGA